MSKPEIRVAHRTVNGLTTHYFEAGDPKAPPLLLLHDGAFGSEGRSCWDPLVPLLADRYRIIAPDLLGFGGSAKVFFFDADPLSQRIVHIAAFCEQLELARLVVVGASFGGGMVLRAAASGALPMSAGVSISGPGGLHMVGEQFAKLQDFDGTEAAARRIAELMAVRVSEADVAHRLANATIPGHWETLASARLRRPGAEPGPDFRESFRAALSTIEVPILLVAGERDVLLEPGWENALAELIPGARTERLAHCRHLPQLDRPEEVAGLLTGFAALAGATG